MTIAVIGATGKVGTPVARGLLADGQRVTTAGAGSSSVRVLAPVASVAGERAREVRHERL